MPHSGEPTVEGIDVEGIREYLAQTEVDFAILFGSHARGTADSASDLDIALRFAERMDEHTRFHRRNRIDAELQEYANGFVDVSDIDALPDHVAYAALQEGILLTGDEQAAEEYKAEIETAYENEADKREQERQEFIDRLARGNI